MSLPGRWLTSLLSTAVLFAATLPCPTVERGAVVVASHAAQVDHAAAHAGHTGDPAAGHTHRGVSPERESAAPCHEPPILSVLCPCGCNQVRAGGSGRLGAVLPSHATAAQALHAALSVQAEPSRIPAEPCFTPDPIPI